MKKPLFYLPLFFAITISVLFHANAHGHNFVSVRTAIVLPDTNSVDTATCDPNIRVQKSFCPNCDDVNDLFHPMAQGEGPESIDMVIMDRWGSFVYTEKSADPSWNGEMSNGNECEEGAYFWTLTMTYEYNEKEKCMGFVVLER